MLEPRGGAGLNLVHGAGSHIHYLHKLCTLLSQEGEREKRVNLGSMLLASCAGSV